MKNSPVRIAVVDDEIGFVEALCLYLDHIPKIEIVGVARSANSFLRQSEDWPEIDVLLVDVKMETQHAGLQLVEHIQAATKKPNTIIFLTAESSGEMIRTVYDMKCSFLDKSCSLAQVVRVIQYCYENNRIVIDIPDI